MAEKTIKVTFTLHEKDERYFRRLYNHAKKASRDRDAERILREAKKLVDCVAKSKRIPEFVTEAVDNLDALIQMLDDPDYVVTKKVRQEVVAALAYFANPDDLIPDAIPAFGFLDDAIMIKFVEDELKHDLWAYRKFRQFRKDSEQRPWTKVAEARQPQRLADFQKKLRVKIKQRKDAEHLRRKALKTLGW